MKKLLYILLLSVLSLPMAAQVVYQCDFEDEAERSQWELNPGNRASRCENWWYIGKAGDYSENGSYGLYVATKANPDTLTYTSSATMMTVAYRTLTLTRGDYMLMFDWIGKFKNNGEEGVYVYWAPDSLEALSMPTFDLFEWQKNSTYSLRNSTSRATPLYNQGMWDRARLPLKVLGATETRRLMFVLYTSKGEPTNPSFALDNIEIAYDTECSFPTDISHELNDDGTATVLWQSSTDAIAYDVRLRDMQSGIWYNRQISNSNANWDGMLQMNFAALEEGAQMVQVRSLCVTDGDTVHSDWRSYYFLNFHKGERCVDYMQLDETTCSWQTSYSIDPVTNEPVLPYNLVNVGAVDKGSDDYLNSMHTLHYMPNEYDPYTMNHLRTKPDGALAAVRIGRYEPTHMSRVRYNYTIPENEDKILVLRYALVLPNPHPESPEANPIFAMETLIDGEPMEGGCGDANFTSGYGDALGWENSKDYGGKDIYFKDWTTVSLNMKDHPGQTFTVTFTTTGCAYSAHGGYGYITLSCESGEMSGLNCGEENPTTTFTAPAGFTYRWWKDSRDEVLSTKRSFTIAPMDTSTYRVDLITFNEECYHTLEVTGIPRLPHVEAGVRKYEVVNCENAVTLYNNSYVLYKATHKEWDPNTRDSIIVVDRTFTKGELLDNIEWNFGDGSPRVHKSDTLLTHIYPKEGGTFTAWMIGTLNGANGECIDSIPVEVNVPPVGYTDVELHVGRGYQYVYADGTRGNTYWSVGNDTILEMIGDCERTTYLHIHETQFSVDTSFCEGGVFYLGEQAITQSGTYKGNLKSVVWPMVDSIVTLHLDVEPSLLVVTADTVSVCGDETAVAFPIQVIQGRMDSVKVLFSPESLQAGFDQNYAFGNEDNVQIDLPDSIKPGYYPATLQLGTPRCPAPDVPVVVQVRYPSSIVAQKDGIIALLNENHNGGYIFSEYKWYRNGQLLRGENDSYLVVSDEDLGAQYTAVLTRPDGVTVAVCPIIYNAGASAVDDVTVTDDGEWMLLDVMGRVVMQSVNNSRPLISTPGVYILVQPATHRAVKIVMQ